MVPAYRKYLKNHSLPGMAEIEIDQMKGLPVPPVQKPYPRDAELIDLVSSARERLHITEKTRVEKAEIAGKLADYKGITPMISAIKWVPEFCGF